MTSRQRGATWLLALLLLGRLLDALDLPFERQLDTHGAREAAEAATQRTAPGSASAPGPPVAGGPGSVSSPAAPATRPAADPSVAIAINRATVAELQALPRVGPVLAARIVAHREAHGPLRSLEDLRRVKGIGASTAARLAPLVRFD